MSTNLLHGRNHLGLHFVHSERSVWGLGRSGCLEILVLVVWGLLLLKMDDIFIYLFLTYTLSLTLCVHTHTGNQIFI